MLRRLTLGLVGLSLAAAFAACSSNDSSTLLNNGLGIGPNFTANTVYAAIASTNAISIYPAPITNGASASYQIGGATTTMVGPQYLAFDSATNLWATNYVVGTGSSQVINFKALATGNVFPLQSFTYTAMGQPRGIAVGANGNVAVAAVYAAAASPGLPSQIQFFTTFDSGPTLPYRVISGSNTDLNVPSGIAYDSTGTLLYVANRQGASVEAFAFPTPSPVPSNTPSPTPSPTPNPSATPTATPTPLNIAFSNVAPLTLISGSNTGLVSPSGVAVDATGQVYVSDAGNASVRVFASNANGNAVPTRVISGALTLLQIPTDVKVDSSGLVYVADAGVGKIFVFASGATGNVAPTMALNASVGIVGIGLLP
ncbi:MAG TPA: hypothetical protein VIJ12_04440 [Candidatus Baltobacteraceae bacterium]